MTSEEQRKMKTLPHRARMSRWFAMCVNGHNHTWTQSAIDAELDRAENEMREKLEKGAQ